MRAPSECVAFIAREVQTVCRSARFTALLETAGERLIWLLYTQDPDEASTFALLKSTYPRLRTVRQPAVTSPAWRTFGAQMIGYSKAAFLLWFIANGSSCQRTWQLEDDVFFTGRWDTIFDAHLSMTHDLIAPVQHVSNRTMRYLRLPQCHHGSGVDNPECGEFRGREDPEAQRAKNCYLDRTTPCARRVQPTITIWPLIRMSQRLAIELQQIMDVRGGHGFHEYLTDTACTNASWCTRAPLQIDMIGELLSGHVGGLPKHAQTLKNLAQLRHHALPGAATSISSNRVFHPVKCEADEGLGTQALIWAQVGGQALSNAALPNQQRQLSCSPSWCSGTRCGPWRNRSCCVHAMDKCRSCPLCRRKSP